jgi:tetratricopeptide (TPR) repeat protein
VLDRYRKFLVGGGGFNQANYQQAAAYCINRNINLKEAAEWIDHSITLQTTGMNLITKSILLDKTGKKDDAADFMKRGISLASENELNNYGYTLMLQENDVDKALEIFKINVEKNPNSWNVYDSLAEAYSKKGDKANASKYYNAALKLAPDNQKQRIERTLQDLK